MATAETAIYFLATPINTPLSAKEVVEFRELHTFTPNTVVTNDSNVVVEIGYREYRR